MKGILLAGGSATRLYPSSISVSKQLMPVYDKPMVFYPLTTLMLAGVVDVLVVTGPEHLSAFERTLGDGSQWGLSIRYAVQPRPEGIPQAFLIGERFIDGSAVALALGDNLLYGSGLSRRLQQVAGAPGATVFAYYVNDPSRYGVVNFDEAGHPTSLEEKPSDPRSHWALIGLYFYDHTVVERSRQLLPSTRGELEITDLNRSFLEDGALHVQRLDRGYAWLDTGTPAALHEAASFVQVVEARQGLKIACPEEVALRMGLVSPEQLERQLAQLPDTPYRAYILRLLDEM